MPSIGVFLKEHYSFYARKSKVKKKHGKCRTIRPKAVFGFVPPSPIYYLRVQNLSTTGGTDYNKDFAAISMIV